jgi:Acetyltransferase (GNAT) domain
VIRAEFGSSFASLDFETVLSRFERFGTLLAGAAIQGEPRTPVGPLATLHCDDGSHVPLWCQRRHTRRTRLVTAGTALTSVPSTNELDNLMTQVCADGEPDVVHIFIDLQTPPPQTPQLAVADFGCYVRRTSYRYVLPLSNDYEAFVQGLGKHSRRNIRLYQRNAEAEGLSFAYAPQAPRNSAAATAERSEVGLMTMPKPKSPRRLDELDAFLRLRRRPFHSTIRTRDGRLISIATGFQAGTSAYLVYQANHNEHADANLALTHRSLLIRALIGDGIRTLVFPNGINDVLRNACRRDHALELLALRAGRFSSRRINRWLALEPGHPAARFHAAAHTAPTAETDDDVVEPAANAA